MADIHGSPGDGQQMPAAPGAGSEPVPYTGPDMRPEPPLYSPPAVVLNPPGAEMMGGVAAAHGVQESGYAHDIASSTVAPYYPGHPSPVYTGGDDDAGGRDEVASTIAEAVANAEARYLEHQSDTFGQGSTIGDLMTFPPGPLDPGTVGGLKGGTDPSGAFYDPPRGGAPETFANTGNEPG